MRSSPVGILCVIALAPLAAASASAQDAAWRTEPATRPPARRTDIDEFTPLRTPASARCVRPRAARSAPIIMARRLARPRIAAPSCVRAAGFAATPCPARRPWWSRLDDPHADALIVARARAQSRSSSRAGAAAPGALAIAAANGPTNCPARAPPAATPMPVCPSSISASSIERRQQGSTGTAARDAAPISTSTLVGFDAPREIDLFGGQRRGDRSGVRATAAAGRPISPTRRSASRRRWRRPMSTCATASDGSRSPHARPTISSRMLDADAAALAARHRRAKSTSSACTTQVDNTRADAHSARRRARRLSRRARRADRRRSRRA